MLKVQIKKINLTKQHQGFSLFELTVTLFLTGIILSSFVYIYREFMRVHNRQGRVMLMERSLDTTQVALQDSMASLSGVGLATSTSSSYAIPSLPIAGSIFDGTNKPIKLGIVTPYKINGNDAFTVVYSDPTIPRLSLDTVFTQIGSVKVFRVPLPSVQITKSGGVSGSGAIKGKDDGSEGDSKNDIDIGNDSSSTNNASVPTVDMFQIGQIMAVVNSPTASASTTTTNVTAASTVLVRLLNVTKAKTLNTQFLQFTCEVCESGCSGLTNETNNINISAGAILVPIKLATFYLKTDRFANKLIRNDGGVALPTGINSFSVNSGKETVVGETDSLTVNYRLADGSILPTPNSPIVPWLNSVTSVDITIGEAMNGINKEYLNHSAKVNFLINSQNIQ